MKMKLILAMVPDEKTNEVVEAARQAGATGATIINSVRGEGLMPQKSFLGLDLMAQRDLLLFVVAQPLARFILEAIEKAANMDGEQGAGIALQIAIEDAVGLKTQTPIILNEIKDEV